MITLLLIDTPLALFLAALRLTRRLLKPFQQPQQQRDCTLGQTSDDPYDNPEIAALIEDIKNQRAATHNGTAPQ